MMTKMTMNINELADTLGVSVKAIYNRRNESPETLPKPLDISWAPFRNGIMR